MISESHIPITNDDIRKRWGITQPLLTEVVWNVSVDATKVLSGETERKPGDKGYFQSSVLRGSRMETASMMSAFKRISDDPYALTDNVVAISDAIRMGSSIGMHLAGLYDKATGLGHLRDTNARPGGLPESQEPELNSKQRTASAILVFSAASYIYWKLSQYKTDEVSQINVHFNGVPEIDISMSTKSLNCMLYYLAWYYEKSGSVNTELEMVKITLLYFENILENLRDYLKSLEYTEAFAEVKYKLEDSDFIIEGFDSTQSVVSVSNFFKRFEFKEMVGNKLVKIWGRRSAMRLCLYDPELQKNPAMEMGGLATFRMGYGVPGTGKTLSIRCIATIISDFAEKRGIPFIFHPLPDDLISQYQGGSAERMKNWMKPLYDSNSIVYAPADDAENNFRNRSHSGASEGSNQVIAVFLRGSEGAGAQLHGNSMMDFMTNIPEIIDPAVTSRIQARFPIDGAQTVNDWADQHHLWFSEFAKHNPDFVKVNPLPGYKYGDDQDSVASFTEIEKGVYTPKHSDLKSIFENVQQDWKFNDVGFTAHLLNDAQERFPGFSSRDLRNIQTAMDDRLNDYDVPESWFDHPSEFFEKPYDERVEILRELQRESFQGLSFGEVCVSEALRYIDNYASMADRDFERQVGEAVKRGEIHAVAEVRLSKMSGRKTG